MNKTSRKSFAKTQIRTDLPNLIETQKVSYDAFLQRDVSPDERIDTGLQAVFKEVFPIRDFSEVNSLEFVSYTLGTPKYTLQECIARGVTYQVSLTARIMLVLREADPDADEPHVVDIRESDVYLGEVPLMTENGSFIVNGSERVIVSQLHRSPGVIFLEKSLPTGRRTPTAQIIPYRGAWVEFEIDTKDQIYVRIDKRRKLPATVLLRALGWASDTDILKLYAKTERLVLDGWQVTHVEGPAIQVKAGDLLDAAEFRQASKDYPDLETEKYYRVTLVPDEDKDSSLEIGQLISEKERTSLRRKWKGFETELLRRVVDTYDSGCEFTIGQILTNSEYEAARDRYRKNAFTAEQILSEDAQDRVCAEDVIHQETGEVLLTANTLLTENELERLKESGVEALTVLDVEDCQRIRFLRNTLEKDRQVDYEEQYSLQDAALLTIFRTLRPGDTTNIENARKHLTWLLFDSHRYDLGVVGRYKLNRKFHGISVYGEPPEEALRTLRPEDIAATVDYLLKVHNGLKPKDDLDHLGNRRVRVIGELLENQFRMGLFQIRRTTRERLSTNNDVAKVVPSSLVNPKPLMMALREFFGSNQLSQFMQQINPLDELTHKRRISAIGPGGLHRDRATAAVRDVHRTHFGRVCPLETPEGPSIGLIVSLACYGRINPYGFIETPYRKVEVGYTITDVCYSEFPHKVEDFISKEKYEELRKDYPGLKKGDVLSEAEAEKWNNLRTLNGKYITEVSHLEFPFKVEDFISKEKYEELRKDYPGLKKGTILTSAEYTGWRDLEANLVHRVTRVFYPESSFKDGDVLTDNKYRQALMDSPGFTVDECYKVTAAPTRALTVEEQYKVVAGAPELGKTMAELPKNTGPSKEEHNAVQEVVSEYLSKRFENYTVKEEWDTQDNFLRECDIAVLNSKEEPVVIAECKGKKGDSKGQEQLGSYLSATRARFGIFANNSDPNTWVFFENLRHNKFRSIARDEFEKLEHSDMSPYEKWELKTDIDNEESSSDPIDETFTDYFQKIVPGCTPEENVEIQIGSDDSQTGFTVLRGEDGSYVAIANQKLGRDLQPALLATDTPFGIYRSSESDSPKFHEIGNSNPRDRDTFEQAIVEQLKKSSCPIKGTILTKTKKEKYEAEYPGLITEKFWHVTEVNRKDCSFKVGKELSDADYQEACKKYPDCPISVGDQLPKTEWEHHSKTWKGLEAERVWRVNAVYHSDCSFEVGKLLSDSEYEKAREGYPGLIADECYTATKAKDSFTVEERMQVIEDHPAFEVGDPIYGVGDVEYLTADSEDTAYIAAKTASRDASETTNGGAATSEYLLPVRSGEDVLSLPMEKVDYIGVSPQQIVGISAALVPFLEHEDANRALMGANHQRQAVPLIRPEAPLVGTGMEEPAARYSGALITAKRGGIVTSVSADEILIYTGEALHHDAGENTFSEMGYDVYKLQTFKRSNSGTCIHQRPIVAVGDKVEAGQVIVDGTSTESGELALGRNILCAYMPWGGHNYEDSILISETLIKEDTFTSIHIEEFEVEARETKVGPEEITRDIPNVSDQRLSQLDEEGIIYVGSVVKAGSILVGKITPKGESEYGPEEKLLRAIFGEKVKEVRDASTYVRPGVEGVVIDVKVFSRKPDGGQRRGNWMQDDSGLSMADGLRYESKRKEIEETWQQQTTSIRRRKVEEIRNALIGCELVNPLYAVDASEPFANAGDILTAEVLDTYISGFTADEYYTVTEDTAAEVFIAEPRYKVTSVPEPIPTIATHTPDALAENAETTDSDEDEDFEAVGISSVASSEIVSAVEAYLSKVCKPLLGDSELHLEDEEPLSTQTGHADVSLLGYDGSVVAIALDKSTHADNEDSEDELDTEQLKETLATTNARFGILLTEEDLEPDNYDFYELVDNTTLEARERSEFEQSVVAQLEEAGCPVVEGEELTEAAWTDYSEIYPGLQAEIFWQIKEVFDTECPLTDGQELSDAEYQEARSDYPARLVEAGQQLTAEEREALSQTARDLKTESTWHITAVFDPKCTLSVGEYASDADYQKARKACSLSFSDINVTNAEAKEHIQRIEEMAQGRITTYTDEKEQALQQLEMGDELKPGVIKRVKVYVASKRPISIGDKMAGRYGNKGVVAKILPAEDMPYLPDGTPVELVLNPLGVPSRMNVGQILEIHLGWACHELGIRAESPVFDGATEKEVFEMLGKTDLPDRSKRTGKSILFDGRTGEPFAQEVTVGYVYFLKLNHLVADKMHARSTGPYSLVTQQPLGGKAQHGGQRLGEMEVWALEAYGAAHTLQEMLTLKSDDVLGRREIYESVVKGLNPDPPGTPESFNVLVRELQALGLRVEDIEDAMDTIEEVRNRSED